eukprot:SAG31_NODE_8280_length_1481_cov_1.443560_2_plen_95_part_01
MQLPFWCYLIKVATNNLLRMYQMSKVEAAAELRQKQKMSQLGVEVGVVSMQVVGAQIKPSDEAMDAVYAVSICCLQMRRMTPTVSSSNSGGTISC